MDDSIKNINDYLKIIKNEYKEIQIESSTLDKEKFSSKKNKKIVYILGNTSCDLDSFLSCLLISIFRNLLIETENIKIKMVNNSESLKIPIFNCNREDFPDRLDISYLLSQYSIESENLIFIDDEKLIEDFTLMKHGYDEPKDESNKGKTKKII